MMTALSFFVLCFLVCVVLQAAVFYFSFVAFLFIFKKEESLSGCFSKVNAYLGDVVA